MRLLTGFALLCAAVTICAFDARAEAPSPPPPGARAYQDNCGVCHIGGRIGPPLSRWNIDGREADLRTKVLEGGVKMPAFKYMLDGKDVDLIFSYLKTLDKPPALVGTGGGTP